MDQQMQSTSVSTPSHASMHKRRTLLITIIVVALLVVGWILYSRSVSSPENLTVEEQHAMILNHLEQPGPQVPAAQKQEILGNLETQNTASAKAKNPVQSGPSAEDKAAILNHLAK